MNLTLEQFMIAEAWLRNGSCPRCGFKVRWFNGTVGSGVWECKTCDVIGELHG
jgi:ribosomal protein L37AE/L43A